MISFLTCNFLSLSCPYFLLFTAVVVEEFQEVNLLSVFTDVSSTSCPFLKQICFLWRCSAPFHGPSGSSASPEQACDQPQEHPGEVLVGHVLLCSCLLRKSVTLWFPSQETYLCWKGNIFPFERQCHEENRRTFKAVRLEVLCVTRSVPCPLGMG